MKTIRNSLFKGASLLVLACVLANVSPKLYAQADPQKVTKENFKGKISLDVRDSKEDWTPYSPKKAPEGSPNILFILYDDTGLAALSPYGGAINMPTM